MTHPTFTTIVATLLSVVPASFSLSQNVDPPDVQTAQATPRPIASTNSDGTDVPQVSPLQVRQASANDKSGDIPIVQMADHSTYSLGDETFFEEEIVHESVLDSVAADVSLLNETISEDLIESLSDLSNRPYDHYRAQTGQFVWLPAEANNFGWVSMTTDPYLERNESAGFTSAVNMHFLSGPDTIHLPPRLFDFVFGYQARKSVGSIFSYDIAVSAGVYSDFEDSARQGVRFVSHAVAMIHASNRIDLIFGVDYLDRDDISILPVFGFSWRPYLDARIRVDAIFPRPKIEWVIDPEHSVYLKAQLGGGTWDIEFPDESNDVMTYRDYQILFGFLNHDSDGHSNSWELGYVFDREMEFRDRSDSLQFDNGFIFRSVTQY